MKTTPLRFLVSLPERLVRATFAGAGGALEESVYLLLPRLVRRSRIYDVTAKNVLRMAVELVGGVAPTRIDTDAERLSGGRLVAQKTAGNVVELGTIAAFGFSPLWLLAGAADVLNGTRVYLRALEGELAAAGLIAADTHFSSVDQLVGALEGMADGTTTFLDLPPLELAELKSSLKELRDDATSLPAPAELARLFEGLVRTARAERRSLLEVSSGIGLAFLTSARNVGRQHLVTPYREDWAPLAREGFGAYASRISRPYRAALAGHFNPSRPTYTDDLPRLAGRLGGWLGRRARALRLGRDGR